MTDKKYQALTIRPGLRIYTARSDNPRALLETVRKEIQALTGVPRVTMSQAAVAALRDWLRMRREAERRG